MKRMIKGRICNEATETHPCRLSCSPPYNGYVWHEAELHRTRGGAFFLAGSGNGRSTWRNVGRELRVGDPLSGVLQ